MRVSFLLLPVQNAFGTNNLCLPWVSLLVLCPRPLTAVWDVSELHMDHLKRFTVSVVAAKPEISEGAAGSSFAAR